MSSLLLKLGRKRGIRSSVTARSRSYEHPQMIRATQVRPQHRWTQAPADSVVLDFDDRHRRRMAMRCTRGLEFLLDLENATVLRGGDALVLEDNRLMQDVAAPELLIATRGNDLQHLEL